MKTFTKFLASLVLMVVMLPTIASAQLNVSQGGTGLTSVTANNILYGVSASLRLGSEAAFQYNPSTNRLTVDYASTTGFTASNADLSLLTIGSATSTNFFTTNASGTTMRGFGLADCDGAGNAITWDVTAGKFGCGTITGVGDGVSNWLYNGSRLTPSTTVGIGVFASSTISHLSMTNATATAATATNMFATTLTSTNAFLTNLVLGCSSCITDANVSNTLTASAVPVGGITGLGSNVATWLATPSSANLASAVTGETGSGALVFGTLPTFSQFLSQGSSTIGDGTGAGGLTVNGTATSTNLKVTALTASRLVATAADKLMTSVSNLASWIAGTSNEITVTDDGDGTVTLSLPATIDLGGKTSFEIPNGTGPTISAAGQIALDTTDMQLLVGTSTSANPGVIRIIDTIAKFKVPSTSPMFATSTTTYFPTEEDGYTVTDIFCSVEGGTSKIITLFGESITCDTDGQADDGAITINTIAAASTTVPFTAGNTSGVVNWLNVTVKGKWTRE